MLPQSQPRKKRNSSRVNLTISFIVHAGLVAVLFYFAAREGFLGKQIQKITVQMVKEKPPEKPKEPEPPKVEPPKIETPKVAPPKIEAPTVEVPPVVAPPTVAPPSTELPAFEFGGGKTVETSADPVQLYKGFIEYTLRSKWARPEDIADDDFVAEVELSVDQQGRVSDPQWRKNSGNSRWDASVRQALAAVKTISRPPPTNFPARVTIRFDVQEQTQPLLQ